MRLKFRKAPGNDYKLPCYEAVVVTEYQASQFERVVAQVRKVDKGHWSMASDALGDLPSQGSLGEIKQVLESTLLKKIGVRR